MDERTQRIIEVAIELAERDGFEAVRLRDLASKAGVALGTVYKRFSSKEDILAAALEMQVARLRETIVASPIRGDDPQQRLRTFFNVATSALATQPKLAAAMLRTVASGDPELSEKVTRYHGEMTAIIVMVMRNDYGDAFPTEDEQMMAHLLQNVWFASLVGWTGGLHDTERVIEIITRATTLLCAGLAAEQ